MLRAYDVQFRQVGLDCIQEVQVSSAVQRDRERRRGREETGDGGRGGEVAREGGEEETMEKWRDNERVGRR